MSNKFKSSVFYHLYPPSKDMQMYIYIYAKLLYRSQKPDPELQIPNAIQEAEAKAVTETTEVTEHPKLYISLRENLLPLLSLL